MASAASSAASRPVAGASLQSRPTSAQQGWWNRARNGAQRALFAPARGVTAEAIQGAADRFSQLFANNQEEITNRVRDVFFNALMRRAPENFLELKERIHTFQSTPSRDGLHEIQRLLTTINADGILAMAPDINHGDIPALTELRERLNREVTIPVEADAPVILNPAATTALQDAERLLEAIIENQEGALIRTLNLASDSLGAPDGPLQALRQQLNHPETGLLSESLRLVRQQLTSRAHPQLRACKEAMDRYRAALTRQATPQEILPLFRNLHTTFGELSRERAQLPQVTAEEWGVLERWDGEIQAINTPEQMPASGQLLTQSDAACTLLTRIFEAQRGMVEEAADILVEAFARGVEHLVPLPHRMLQNIISPNASAAPVSPPPAGMPAPASPSPPASGSSNAILNVGNLAAQAQGFLNSVLASSGGAMSQMAAQSLATLLRYTFQKIRDHVQGDGSHTHLLGTIDGMITTLQQAIDQGSWDPLRQALGEAQAFLQGQQVYLQGLRLPINSVKTQGSAIPQLLGTINAHQNALQPPSLKSPSRVNEAMIRAQASLLKARSSSYGPARLIAEKICGLQGGPSLYAELFSVKDNTAASDLPALFRNRLFAKIDLSEAHFVTKWVAKRLYTLLHSLSAFYIHSTLEKVLTQITEWIDRPPSVAESKEEDLIKRVRNWMAVTSGAYNEVANAPPSQAKDFGAMMEEALKLPCRNGGLSQKELYSAVAKTALDSFGPRIRWSQSVNHYFSREIPQHSPLYFLNPVAKGLNFFCSLCLNAFLFVPQWIGNQILQTSAKIALSHSPFLKDYSEQSIESLRRNTPSSYAVQCMIFRQQQKILALLQKHLNEEASGNPGLLARSTNIKKIEIRGLIEYALEILGKSQYRTQDRLRNYLNFRNALRDRMGRELEETALPEAMETAITTLSISLQGLTEKEEMQQMLYDSLQIANDAFNISEPVSDEKFAAVEKAIREMTDQILETSLFHALSEKFDFTNEKQQKGITLFYSTLKGQAQQFSEELTALSSRMTPNASLTTPALDQMVTSMVESSAKFHQKRLEGLGSSDGNRNFHTETKHRLNTLSGQILEKSSPLSGLLNEMKAKVDRMSHCDRVLAPLLLSSQPLHQIQEKLHNPSPTAEDLLFLKDRLFQLQKHEASLRQHLGQDPLTVALDNYLMEMSDTLYRIEEQKRADPIFLQAFPLIQRLYEEKLKGIGIPPSLQLKTLEKQLCDLLQQLPVPAERTQLIARVLTLMHSQSSREAAAARETLISTHMQLAAAHHEELRRQVASLQTNQNAMKALISQSVQEFSHQYMEHQRALEQHSCGVATQARELNGWIQNQPEPRLWNLFLFDMKWVTEIVKNLAYDRAKAKVDQLFDALYQRHNYIGFVNQVALLPFLDKFGKHHLKKDH